MDESDSIYASELAEFARNLAKGAAPMNESMMDAESVDSEVLGLNNEQKHRERFSNKDYLGANAFSNENFDLLAHLEIKAVRRQLYALFRDDPKRRDRISKHEVIAEVRLAVETWQRLEAEPTSGDETRRSPLVFVRDHLSVQVMGCIELDCLHDLARLQVRDRELLGQLVDAWIETAMNVIDGEINSRVHEESDEHIMIFSSARSRTFTYTFSDEPLSYKHQMANINKWIKTVVRPQLEMLTNLLGVPAGGRPRENTLLYAKALFRVQIEEQFIRSTAKELLQDSRRTSDLKKGMKMVRMLLGGDDVTRNGPGA